MIRWLFSSLVVLAMAAPAGAELTTLDEVKDCMEGNMPDTSSVQTVVLSSHDRIGSVTQSRAKIYWRKFDDELSKVLVRLSDPPEMRGAAILMEEKKGGRSDILMYLPELDRVKRVTGHMMSGSMFGTDFSYEEFESLQGLENTDFEQALMPGAEVDGRPVYVIEATAKPDLEEKPNYHHTITYVDHATCNPIKIEFYERENKIRKRMEGDVRRIEKRGDRYVMQRIQMFDLRDDTRTEMEIEEIDFDVKVSRSLFSARALERMGGKTF
jgi:hypothetical protein